MKNPALFYKISIGIILVVSAWVITFFFPLYIEYWREYLGWILLALLALTCASPAGHLVIGDARAKIPLAACWRKIIVSYLIIGLFLCGFFVLMLTNVVSLKQYALHEVLQENFTQLGYSPLLYPWTLYLFAAILIGGIGYFLQKPKMSAVGMDIFPARFTSGIFAQSIDFLVSASFYVLMLILAGMSVLALAQLICAVLGFPLDLRVDISIIGLGFALTYLPISPMWKKFIERFRKVPLNPGASLLCLVILLSLFSLFMYGVFLLFLYKFAHYFSPLEAQMRQMDLRAQFTQLSIADLLWGLSIMSMTVVGAWWAQVVQGYTIRQAVIFLLIPWILGCLLFIVLDSMGWLILYHLAPLVEWMCEAPQAYMISLLPLIFLAAGLWRKNNFTSALFWVSPYEWDDDIKKMRELVVGATPVIVSIVTVNLLSGLYFLKTLVPLFAVMVSLIFAFVIISYTINLIRGKYHGKKTI